MPLVLDSLEKAIDSLRRSVKAADENLGSLGADLRDTVRAGVIQTYEVAYEECWKFMQRWLRENSSLEDADNFRSRKELFRLAARQGLLADPVPWFEVAEARNLSSHTYDAAHAAATYETARRFLPFAEDFQRRLEAKND